VSRPVCFDQFKDFFFRSEANRLAFLGEPNRPCADGAVPVLPIIDSVRPTAAQGRFAAITQRGCRTNN
jgi:hypothetical protein